MQTMRLWYRLGQFDNLNNRRLDALMEEMHHDRRYMHRFPTLVAGDQGLSRRLGIPERQLLNVHRQYGGRSTSRSRSRSRSRFENDFYHTRNDRNNAVKQLTLNAVPFGVTMPVTNRRNDIITLENVPFGKQVYLQDDLDDDGNPRRVYALSDIVALMNQRNPVTRRRFSANNVRRVKG